MSAYIPCSSPMNRIESIDVFRALTMILMIWVIFGQENRTSFRSNIKGNQSTLSPKYSKIATINKATEVWLG